MLTPDQDHAHTWFAWDGKKIKATDLNWEGYLFPDVKPLVTWAMDLWAQSGQVADSMFRDLVYPWVNGDMQVTYNTIVLAGMASPTTTKFTLKHTLWSQFDGTNIIVKPWQVCEIQASIYYTSALLRISTSGAWQRPLWWVQTDLSTYSPAFTFINSWITDVNLKFKYADTSWNKPIVWILVKIY